MTQVLCDIPPPRLISGELWLLEAVETTDAC